MYRPIIAKTHKNDAIQDLYNVVTVNEAARLANVVPATIIYHVDRMSLIYRETDRLILISRASLETLYGLKDTWDRLIQMYDV